MRWYNASRAYFAFVVYGLGVLLLGAPHLYALLLWDAALKVDRSLHRRRVARWQLFWGTLLGSAVFRIMGVKVEMILPWVRDSGRPFVVVSNHPSGPLDGFLLMSLLVRLGRLDFRSIMKREAASMPVIGRSCVETECAFLARGSDKDGDLEEIARCARVARLDRASVIIFPEGTRFRGPKEGSGLSRVLPPKSGGLRALITELPGHDVLSVTIIWDRDIRNGKRTASNLGTYVGAKVTVESNVQLLRLKPHLVEAWLSREWKNKDERLSKAG